jgi:hypothetical protein
LLIIMISSREREREREKNKNKYIFKESYFIHVLLYICALLFYKDY